MTRVYSQKKGDPNIVVIADGVTPERAKAVIGEYAHHWIKTKRGRTVVPADPLELHLMFSDKKLAVTMWIDPFPAPKGESKFAAASGPIPGLKV